MTDPKWLLWSDYPVPGLKGLDSFVSCSKESYRATELARFGELCLGVLGESKLPTHCWPKEEGQLRRELASLDCCWLIRAL